MQTEQTRSRPVRAVGFARFTLKGARFAKPLRHLGTLRERHFLNKLQHRCFHSLGRGIRRANPTSDTWSGRMKCNWLDQKSRSGAVGRLQGGITCTPSVLHSWIQQYRARGILRNRVSVITVRRCWPGEIPSGPNKVIILADAVLLSQTLASYPEVPSIG